MFVSPTLLGGKQLSPGTSNLVLSDVLDVFQPWAQFARDTIHSGELPTWNPYTLSGSPFFANPQTAVLGPFNLPIWVLPFKYGLAISAALKVWVAAMGMFLLVRRLGPSFWPALLAGFAFGFLPFSILWLQYPLLSVWAFLPWMLWAAEGIVTKGGTRNVAWLGLAAGGAFLGGHYESAAHAASVIGLYVVIRLLLEADVARGERWRRFGLAALGGALGAMVAAAVLLPSLISLQDAAYAQGRAAHGAFHLPFSSSATLLFPDWWGRPTTLLLPGAFVNYNENTMYPGAVALVLALIGAASTAWRRTLPWIVLAVIGLCAPLGIAPIGTITEHLPPFSMTTNTRLIWLLGLATVVLAAFGAERLITAPKPSRRTVAIGAGAVAAGLIALVAITPTFHEFKLAQNTLRTGALWPDAIRLMSVLWFVFLAAIVLAAILLRSRIGAVGVIAVLFIALGLDLGRFAHRYNPYVETSVAAPAPKLGNQRVLIDGLQPDRQMATRLRDARGYDPPLPRMRYWRVWERAIPGLGLAAPLNIATPVAPEHKRLLRLLAVQAFVQPDGTIKRDPEAPPRALIPSSIHPVANEQQALDAMYAPAFVPRDEVVVEGGAPPVATGRVAIIHDGNARVDLRAQLQRGGLVVLNDQIDDGWSVKVDGRDARKLRVNSVMRGVDVPAGTHVVSWTYRVPGLLPGTVLSVLGILSIVALALWPRRRRRSA